MRKTFTATLLLGCISQFALSQEMPLVFSKAFAEKGNQYKKVIVLEDENIIGVGGGVHGIISKLEPSGNILFNKTIDKASTICYNDVVVDKNGDIVAVGGGTVALGDAVITKMNAKGDVIFQKTLGNGHGGYFTRVSIDTADNSYLLIGTDGSKPARGRVTKFTSRGKLLFDLAVGENTVYTDFVTDEDGNIIAAGGDVGNNEGHARITKVTAFGEMVYDKSFANPGSLYKRIILLPDGYSVLAIGGGAYGSGNGCRISKLREDGQIVFDKQYGVADGTFGSVVVNNFGQIIACAEEYNQGRIVKLRPDGTEIYNKIFNGPLYAVRAAGNGDVVAVGASLYAYSGKLVKLNPDGLVYYDKTVTHPLRSMLLSEDGEIYATSKKDYYLMKFGPDGNEMFTKRIAEFGSRRDSLLDITYLNELVMTPKGELIAAGGGREDGGRMLKITHGIAVNDITVAEPLNGVTTATLTVSLTGFLRKNGARSPVTVHYKTEKKGDQGGADETDFKPTEGILSFVPADYQVGNPISQTVEIPILNDSFLEGTEQFTVKLSDCDNAYIMKPEGVVDILDQPGFIRFIGGRKGREPDYPLAYTIGIFKSDNTALVNKTGSDITVTYGFGNGSATPDVDFLARTRTKFNIRPEAGTGELEVKVKDDNNYEVEESVVLTLGDIQTDNKADIKYEGDATTISRTEYIADQPAFVEIERLADRNESSTAPASMFRISLAKISDRTSLVNCSGSDIEIQFESDSSGTAIMGRDYVILDGDILKITGQCDQAEANVKVSVINDREKEQDETIALRIVKLKWPPKGGPMGFDPRLDHRVAVAKIRDDD